MTVQLKYKKVSIKKRSLLNYSIQTILIVSFFSCSYNKRSYSTPCEKALLEIDKQSKTSIFFHSLVNYQTAVHLYSHSNKGDSLQKLKESTENIENELSEWAKYKIIQDVSSTYVDSFNDTDTAISLLERISIPQLKRLALGDLTLKLLREKDTTSKEGYNTVLSILDKMRGIPISTFQQYCPGKPDFLEIAVILISDSRYSDALHISEYIEPAIDKKYFLQELIRRFENVKGKDSLDSVIREATMQLSHIDKVLIAQKNRAMLTGKISNAFLSKYREIRVEDFTTLQRKSEQVNDKEMSNWIQKRLNYEKTLKKDRLVMCPMDYEREFEQMYGYFENKTIAKSKVEECYKKIQSNDIDGALRLAIREPSIHDKAIMFVMITAKCYKN